MSQPQPPPEPPHQEPPQEPPHQEQPQPEPQLQLEPPEPPHQEPPQPEPLVRLEPPQPGPLLQVEPPQPEPLQVEPPQPEPLQVEPPQPEPLLRLEPPQPEPLRLEPPQPEPLPLTPPEPESPQQEPPQLEPPQLEPRQLEPARRARGRPRGSRGLRPRRTQIERPTFTDYDRAYFDAYSHVGVHEEMIKDSVRTDTYRAAIQQHQSFIAGKVVLDVGCGTGILSIFCAQAGAKRVYAVEASGIAHQAEEVMKANNLSDIIVVLHGRVEDVEIVEQVDVIISEWMGYALLYESMLGSVIFARNSWLKPGGLILPSHATLYMAPFTHPNRYRESVDFWQNVYGINMSAMLSLAKQHAFEEPSVETITGQNILAWPHVVKYIDCYSVTIPELESITSRYKFNSMVQASLHGFAFWFDVEFAGPHIAPISMIPSSSSSASISSSDKRPKYDSQRRKRPNPNDPPLLSTAPEDPPTHWQQTLIYLFDPIEVEQDQLIKGSVALSQSTENARFLNINIAYSTGDRNYVKQSVLR